LYYKNKIEHIVWREQEAIKSVKRLGESPELSAFLEKSCNDIANSGRREATRLEEALNLIVKASNLTLPSELEETEAHQALKKLIPRRLFRGTLGGDLLKKELGEKEYEWYQEIDEKDSEFWKKAAEILNFMDGKRSVHEIVKAVSAEYTETNLEYVLKFLRDLEKTKLVAF
jgi:hypothetical protein